MPIPWVGFKRAPGIADGAPAPLKQATGMPGVRSWEDVRAPSMFWQNFYFFLRFSSTGALAFFRNLCSHQFW